MLIIKKVNLLIFFSKHLVYFKHVYNFVMRNVQIRNTVCPIIIV